MKKSRTIKRSSVYPLLLLEEIFPHARRHRILKALTIIIALLAVALGTVYGLESVLSVSVTGISPEALLGGMLVLVPFWLFVAGLEFYYRSLFFRNMHRSDEMDFPVLSLCYYTKEGDLLETFLLSSIGEHICARLEIPASEISAFAAEHPDRRTPLSALHDAGVVTLYDLATYFISTSDAFREFLFAHGVQEEEYLGAAQWVTELYYTSLMHEEWWARERLERTEGIGVSWTYGHAYILRQYGTELFVAPSTSATQYSESVALAEAALAKAREANALLVGTYAEGLRDVVYALTQKIRNRQTVQALFNKRVVMVDTAFLISQTEERIALERTLEEILVQSAHAGNVILVLESFPQFLENASAIGADVRAVLSRYLGSTRLQVIALSDTGGYHQTVRGMNDMMAFFEVVFVEGGDVRGAVRLLTGTALSLEADRNVFISYKAMLEAAHAADRYFQEGSVEDKARDIITESVALAEQQGVSVVTAKLIRTLVEKKTNVPVGDLEAGEKEKLLNLETLLHERVVGQEEAIKMLSNTMRRLRAGVRDEKKPIGTFLFLGPTGVGKTETAKSLAAVFFGDEDVLMRLDMSEYVGEDALERLIGSFEHGKPGVLARMLREQQYGVILLDEFEKTSPEVLNLFLQIFDEGFFSDMDGTRVNARNIIFIATSNAGSSLIWEAFQNQRDVAMLKDEIIDHIIAQGVYRPELLNRFDGVVIFHPLTDEHLRKIARLMVAKFAKRTEDRGYRVTIDDEALNYLISYGTDPAFGARPMARAIREKAEQVVARKIISDAVPTGGTITITRADLESV